MPNKLPEETKSLFYYFYSRYGKLILGFLIGILLMYKCSDANYAERVPKSVYDSLHVQFNRLQEDVLKREAKISNLEQKIKSLNEIAPVIIDRWHEAKKTDRDIIKNNPCDTSKTLKAFDDATAKCDSVIDNCKTSSSLKDSVITEQKAEITDQKLMVKNKQTELDNTKIDLKLSNQEAKKQKRGKVLSIIVGTVTTIGGIIGTVFILKYDISKDK